MAPQDSPGSPLSDIDSDEFTEDPKFDPDANSREGSISPTDSPSVLTPLPMPPSKRRRTGASSYDHATPLSTNTALGDGDDTTQAPASPTGSLSSDTSGEVPNSPSFAHLGPTHPLSTAYAASQANPDDPDAADSAQVTRCLWTDCPSPEQGNMDNLVTHIHSLHIGLRQKKYSCEWEGCNRKGMPHASGYALRAHMRSHTREKPFYCALPECDRSFTRSDALAKHMRTVHETEALRPSDPVPKNHSSSIANGGNGTGANGNLKRIKLIVSNGEKPKSIINELPPLPADMIHQASGEAEETDMDTVPFELPVPNDYYPAGIALELDDDERSLPSSQWYRLLRRQVHWAEQEGKTLAREIEKLESANEIEGNRPFRAAGEDDKGNKNRRLGWRQTEALIDDVLGKEVQRVREVFLGQSGSGDSQEAWAGVRGMEGLVG